MCHPEQHAMNYFRVGNVVLARINVFAWSNSHEVRADSSPKRHVAMPKEDRQDDAFVRRRTCRADRHRTGPARRWAGLGNRSMRSTNDVTEINTRVIYTKWK